VHMMWKQRQKHLRLPHSAVERRTESDSPKALASINDSKVYISRIGARQYLRG
jgi:hypothetical protein